MKSNDLTIILTLKDRIPFTYRWMNYMNDMKCPYKILIADGGQDKSIEEYLLDASNYPELNYEYIRYPYDETIEDYYRKFGNVLSQVQTKYLLLADNDDFFLLNCIPKFLTFLKDNDEYVGCRGQLVNLTLFGSKGESNNLTKGDYYTATLKQAGSIENDCPYERVGVLCRDMSKYDYYANWYCVFRTSIWQEMWESFLKIKIKDMIVIEILSHILINMRGKIKIFHQPYYIRQSNTSQFGDSLVKGNEFLERGIINNIFSEFSHGIDQLIPMINISEKNRILKAIASWLEIFIVNIYKSNNPSKKNIFWHMTQLKLSYPLLKVWAIKILNLIRKKRSVTLNTIEPYIVLVKKTRF